MEDKSIRESSEDPNRLDKAGSIGNNHNFPIMLISYGQINLNEVKERRVGAWKLNQDLP